MSYIYNVLYLSGLISIFLSTGVGIYRYARLPPALRLIAISLIITSVNEMCGYVIAVVYHRYKVRFVFYHIYDILWSAVCTAFFILAFNPRHRQRWFIANAVFWPVAGIANMLLFQPLDTLNSNMNMLENLIFITLSLLYIYLALKRRDATESIFKDVNVKMSAIFLFYASSTFFFWAFVKLFFSEKWEYRFEMEYLQTVFNIIVYLAIAATLYNYRNAQNDN